VHRNLAANIAEVRELSPRLFAIFIVVACIEILVTVIILGINWKKPCDRSLQWWLALFTMRQCLLVPLHIRSYVRRRAGMSVLRETKAKAWINFVTFVWFIVGQSWLYGSNTCKQTAPSLYIYCLVLIILVYCSLAFPILLLLALCLCFPCVLLFIRMFSEPAGASAATIRNLPSRRYTAPTGAPAGEQPSCAICMENYAEGDQLRVLPCRHEFHTACADKWLEIRDTCPLCRKRITDRPTAAAPSSAPRSVHTATGVAPTSISSTTATTDSSAAAAAASSSSSAVLNTTAAASTALTTSAASLSSSSSLSPSVAVVIDPLSNPPPPSSSLSSKHATTELKQPARDDASHMV